MDPMLNTNSNEEQGTHLNASNENSEKSELMQIFENQVKDNYWAYRDLLKEIFSADIQGAA